MRLYYLDESEGGEYYVRSALGVNAEVWSEVFNFIKNWRKEVKNMYRIPMHKELHAYELLHGHGLLKYENGNYKPLEICEGVQVFNSGLQLLESIAVAFNKQFEVINVSLKKNEYHPIDVVTLERILNRIHSSASASDVERYVFCIFDKGKEKSITQFYRKALTFNPIPSKFGAWESGDKIKHIPPKNIVGGPAFRSSKDDYFLQLVDFVAHALLKKDEKPTERIKKYRINLSFDSLDVCLNKKASEYDEKGIVRR
jgi:hypothetical protein